MIITKNFALIFCSAVLLISCKSAEVVTESNELEETYFKKGEDYRFTLVLKKDYTFEFSKVYVSHGRSHCQGKWYESEDNGLRLKCNDINDPAETLASTYMNKREYFVKRINDSIIKLDDGVILERKIPDSK